MIRPKAIGLLLLAATLLMPAAGECGSFFNIATLAHLPEGDPAKVGPFAIVHPVGYTGAGGTITVRVCVDPSDEELVGPVQWAIDKWNRLEPTTANCQGCLLWEEPPTSTGTVDAQSALLHELGHCIGLGHINLHETDASPTASTTGTCDVDGDGCCKAPVSFTASVNATEVVNGGSGARGDQGDRHLNQCPSTLAATFFGEPSATCNLGEPCPVPAQCCPNGPTPTPMQVEDIAWFRRLDNNPFVIDSLVIDKDSFSRSTANLPAGHQYATSANRATGDALGLSNTQAVMYSGIQLNMRYSGLTADEVNMIKMGMTGADRDAGTSDDYSIVLRYQNDCAGAHIQVRLDGTFIGDNTGACIADMQTSFPQGLLKVHYTLKPVTGFSMLMVDLNPLEPWDFGPRVFSSGFESGDFSEWSTHFP